MASEWEPTKLGDIARMKYGKMPNKNDLVESGYPVFSGYRIVGYHKQYMYEEPQLVVVARGVGGTGDVRISPPKAYITNLSIVLELDKKLVDRRFMFYCLSNHNLRHLDSGSAQSQITISDLSRYRVELPPLPDQQAIAHILGTLDDKIELNRQMNQTLEAMARAIFKSWFVDFDPVRAKMNSPSPGGRGVRGEGIRPAIHTNTPIPTDILDFARQLRRQATDAEALLWRLLRGRRIANAKFRRQHFFPPYILDFYCHELKLAVELDGGQHNLEDDRRRDARRDAYLAEHGIQVLRFWNNDVLRETEAVLEAIYAAVVERVNAVPSPPAPLPGGEGSYPQHILDLFPDRLVDSEMGEIPEGWEVGILGNLSHKPQYGYTASANDEPVGPKFLRITDINKMSWIEWSSVPHCKISDKEFEQYRLREGDILIARMADPGHGVMIEEDIEAVFASYLIRLPLRDSIYKRFIQYWLRSNSYWELVRTRHAGTTRASLNAQVLSTFQLIVPPPAIADAFGKRVAVLRSKITSNVAESRTLAALRDALLPKLISGKLQVPDAERIIGRCV